MCAITEMLLATIPQTHLKVDITTLVERYPLGFEQLALERGVELIADPPGRIDHPPPRHRTRQIRS